MIRTVAELLSGIMQQVLPELDASDISHAPTIGDMYEGLSSDLLGRAIPDGLGIKIVTGFATDGVGNLSGQLDCMLVRGDGEQIPYTDSFVWNVNDIIAVIEVKKTLHRAEMTDALDQLRLVKKLEYGSPEDSSNGRVDISPALTAFAETTRHAASGHEDIDGLSVEDQMIFHTLVMEQISIIRIVLGFHGFKSETAFREALVKILKDNLGVKGFGPGSLPQLIISGAYALFKANGRPYSAGVVNGEWPFYLSTPVNPLLILLEFIWTRLDEIFDIPGLWGEDLELEVARGLLFAKGSRHGWNVRFLKSSTKDLNSVPVTKYWSPAFVNMQEFVILQRLCSGAIVRMDDPKLLDWLQGHGADPDDFLEGLLNTGLVATRNKQLHLIARDCMCAMLPTGELIAAENNTGRLTRWLAKRLTLSQPK
ncbi:DUF6602 domain-containing protein [Amycolatopsis sp. CA-161197]|uniref:DUF6602 domain-containing protein n=1 Tax=Amycolatopsis sp. CA-161197 TaxID=3239922 RepID=UPI003D926B92